GTVTVAGGTVNLGPLGSLSIPNVVVSNGAVLSVNASTGNPLNAGNLVVGTNSTLTLALASAAAGVQASGVLTLQDNATNNFIYGSLLANPLAPAINISVSGGISAPGSNIVINISASGLTTGTFTLIKYTTGTLSSIANFQLNPPPGVVA